MKKWKIISALLSSIVVVSALASPTTIMANEATIKDLLHIETTITHTGRIGARGVAEPVIDVMILPGPDVTEENRGEFLRQADAFSSEMLGMIVQRGEPEYELPLEHELPGEYEKLDEVSPLNIFAPGANLFANHGISVRGSRIDTLLSTRVSNNATFTNAVANGMADAMWWGSALDDPSRIRFTNTFQTTGANVNVSVGSGWSVSGGATSRSVAWTNTVNNGWIIRHNYSNLGFSGLNLHMRQQTTAEFTWGSTTHQVSAFDSSWL